MIPLFAVIIGLLSNSFSKATITSGVQRELHKLGGASIITAKGALGFYFLFFVLVISLRGSKHAPKRFLNSATPSRARARAPTKRANSMVAIAIYAQAGLFISIGRRQEPGTDAIASM